MENHPYRPYYSKDRVRLINQLRDQLDMMTQPKQLENTAYLNISSSNNYIDHKYGSGGGGTINSAKRITNAYASPSRQRSKEAILYNYQQRNNNR